MYLWVPESPKTRVKLMTQYDRLVHQLHNAITELLCAFCETYFSTLFLCLIMGCFLRSNGGIELFSSLLRYCNS